MGDRAARGLRGFALREECSMKSLASSGCVAEIRERMLPLAADDRALWGRMSATQMVHHLGVSCETALGDRVVQPMKGLPPVVMKWLALRSGLRWAKNYPTTPEVARATEEVPAAGFAELVEVAIHKMEEVASGTRWAATHPMFGPMRPADWMRWGYLHADHHLRQFGR